jgi:hypothetical protein
VDAAGTFSALIPTTHSTMPIALRRESGDIYRLDISGVLQKADYRRCEAELKTELERAGSAKLLCVLTGFEGWERGADWSDLSFYVNYGDAIQRIAIVGNERWRSEMLMFAAADLRRGPVEFFPEGDLTKARAWLAG